MRFVSSSDRLPDGTPIPLVRRYSIYVPDAGGQTTLCTGVVLDRRKKLARLEIAPQDGPFNVGDIIEYAWLPDSEFPIVKAGRGQFSALV